MTARADYIAGLRKLADLLETDEQLPLPDSGDIKWYLFGVGLDLAEQKAKAADIVHRIPGPFAKRDTQDLFRFTGRLGGAAGLLVEVIVDRPAVCERVVTGTREVTVEEPDPAAAKVTVTKTVEDVEWRCGSLLGGDAS